MEFIKFVLSVIRDTFLCLTVILSIGANYSRESVEIINKERTIVKQIGMYWCWAATAEAISKYQGKNLVKQEELILLVKNEKELNERVLSSKEMAIYRSDLLLVYENIFKFGYKSPVVSERDFAELGLYKNLKLSNSVMIEISENDVKKELKNNKPVIVVLANHVSLVVGYKRYYDKISYLIMDTASIKPFTRVSKYELNKRGIHGKASFFIVN